MMRQMSSFLLLLLLDSAFNTFKLNILSMKLNELCALLLRFLVMGLQIT